LYGKKENSNISMTISNISKIIYGLHSMLFTWHLISMKKLNVNVPICGYMLFTWHLISMRNLNVNVPIFG
jgi:hypothetical protein